MESEQLWAPLSSPSEPISSEIQVPEERGGSDTGASFRIQQWQVRDGGPAGSVSTEEKKPNNQTLEISELSTVAHTGRLCPWEVKTGETGMQVHRQSRPEYTRLHPKTTAKESSPATCPATSLEFYKVQTSLSLVSRPHGAGSQSPGTRGQKKGGWHLLVQKASLPERFLGLQAGQQ